MWLIGGWSSGGFTGNSDVWSSPDGINWTQRINNAPFGNRAQQQSVVFDGKMWIIGNSSAIGQNDAWSSPDGVTWTKVTILPFYEKAEGQTCLVFDAGNGPEIWSMGGDSGGGAGGNNQVWVSADGANWTEVNSNAPYGYRSYQSGVVYDNKMWIFAGTVGASAPTPPGISSGDQNDAWYSCDGVNWIEATNSAAFAKRQSQESVVFNNQMWVLGGFEVNSNVFNDVWSSGCPALPTPTNTPTSTGTNTPTISVTNTPTSTLTNTPTVTPTITPTITPVSCVLCGPSEGSIWAEINPAAAYGARESSSAVTFNNQMWVIGGVNMVSGQNLSDVWKSSDGANWYSTATIMPTNWLATSAMVYNNQIWVTGNYQSVSNQNGIWSSPDGTSWNQLTTSNLPNSLIIQSGFVFNNAMWVIGDVTSPSNYPILQAWTSTDGNTWTDVNPDITVYGVPRQDSKSSFATLVFNNEMWIIAGSSPAFTGGPTSDVWESPDGVSWSIATPAAAFGLEQAESAVVFDNKMWVFGGNFTNTPPNPVWYSCDGSNWNAATLSANFPIKANATGLQFNNEMWILGNGADVWASGCTVPNTITPTATSTATMTNSPTSTPTMTATNTPTLTLTNTGTFTPSNTATNTITPTLSNTDTQTATNTITNTATITVTNSATNTASNTSTATLTYTPTATYTRIVCGTNPKLDLLVRKVECETNDIKYRFQVYNVDTQPVPLSALSVAMWVYDTTGLMTVSAVDSGYWSTSNNPSSGTPLANMNFTATSLSYCSSGSNRLSNWVLETSTTDTSVLPAGGAWVDSLVDIANHTDTSDYSQEPAAQLGGCTDELSPYQYVSDVHFVLYYYGVPCAEWSSSTQPDPNSGLEPICYATCPRPTATNTPTNTNTLTTTPTPSSTATNTYTPSPTPSFTKTYTASPTSSATSTNTVTVTVTNTPTLAGTPTNGHFVSANVSPTCVTAGANLAVTFVYQDNGTYNTLHYAIAFAPNNQPSSSDNWVVGGDGAGNCPATGAQVSTGSSGLVTVGNTITVPSGFTSGYIVIEANTNVGTLGCGIANNDQVDAVTVLGVSSCTGPTNTYTSTPSFTDTGTSTYTPTSTATPTITNTATNTPSNTYTNTPTKTATVTTTNTATSTVTLTFTFTPSNTPTKTATSTTTNTVTNTGTSTFTPTPSYTPTKTATSTYTNTSTSTLTPTNTFTKTLTPTITNTSTKTPTPTITLTPTPTVVNCSSYPQWTAGATYAVGNQVTYFGNVYVCSQANGPAAPNWDPVDAPSLWTLQYACQSTEPHCSSYPTWSANSVVYNVGTWVTYNGHYYQCMETHTSQTAWDPADTPTLWRDYGACQ